MGPKSPARLIRIPLIAFLVSKLNYIDKALHRDLAHGVEITGVIPKSNVLAPRPTAALKRFAPPRSGLMRRSRTIVKATANTSDPALKAKCWELSWAGQQKSWLSQPQPVTKSGMVDKFTAPRFCIAEQHGLQQHKYRVIDDLSRSHVNATADTSDTYCPHGIDTLVAKTQTLPKIGDTDCREWSVDFSDSYKTIGIHETSREAATVCFVHPHDNVPYKARILAQPFGSGRAPANWGRVVTSIQFLARQLLTLTVGAFFDDVYRAEPASEETSGFGGSKQLDGPIGFPTSEKKDHRPNKNIVLHGAQNSLGSTSFCANARPERINKRRADIAHALQTNRRTHAAASKLRGNSDASPTYYLGNSEGE